MIKLLCSGVSPAGPKARLSVLIFHRVLPAPDPLFPDEVDAERFARICAWVRQWFTVLPLEDAVERLAVGRLPARAMAITFDDGYADNHDIALPILRDHGLTATFFVSTGFLNGGRMWNDTLIEAVRCTPLQALDLADVGLPSLVRLPVGSTEQRRDAVRELIRACRYLPPAQRQQAVEAVAQASRAVLPTTLMMRDAQVRALHAAGMGIGGHTVHHPILARLGAAEARREIVEGKQQLEQLLQAPVPLFAYPNGKPGEDYLEEHAAMVREAGFKGAVSTAWGSAAQGSDRYQLPRFTPWDRGRTAFGLRLVRNMLQRPAPVAPAQRPASNTEHVTP